MSDTSLPVSEYRNAVAEQTPMASDASVGDYVALLKPRVMSLAIFTALVGLVAAPDHLHPILAVVAVLFIAMGAGASGALNMWYDADIDALMARTATRPVPQGHVPAGDALGFGAFLAAVSVVCLGLMVNWVAGALLALAIGYYIFVYTMWLKRRTPQNIVIGGAAGAFPPMIGWAAATGGVSIESISLFLIIFLWTPPHFWSLALFRCRDYERAGIPMLPVVAGPDETRKQILIYSVLMVPAALAPAYLGLGGMAYLVIASAMTAAFLVLAWRVYGERRDPEGSTRAAKQLFGYSIVYLFVLFAVILVEHSLAGLGLWL
jgi:protoheme IX farnesyltransferase